MLEDGPEREISSALGDVVHVFVDASFEPNGGFCGIGGVAYCGAGHVLRSVVVFTDNQRVLGLGVLIKAVTSRGMCHGASLTACSLVLRCAACAASAGHNLLALTLGLDGARRCMLADLPSRPRSVKNMPDRKM
eukprot:s3009_g9.t1